MCNLIYCFIFSSIKDSLLRKKKAKEASNEEDDFDEALENGEDADSDENDENIFEKHKKGLIGLQKTDPEFYKYLKENDEELLNFNESESDEEKEDDEEAIHTAPDTLEVS